MILSQYQTQCDILIISQRGLCLSCRRKPFLKITIGGTTYHSGGNVASSTRQRTKIQFHCVQTLVRRCCSVALGFVSYVLRVWNHCLLITLRDGVSLGSIVQASVVIFVREFIWNALAVSLVLPAFDDTGSLSAPPCWVTYLPGSTLGDCLPFPYGEQAG